MKHFIDTPKIKGKSLASIEQAALLNSRKLSLNLLIENLRDELQKTPSVKSARRTPKSIKSSAHSEAWLTYSLEQLHKMRDIAFVLRGKQFCVEFL